MSGNLSFGSRISASDPRMGSTPVEAVACLLCGSEDSETVFESPVQLAPATGERFRFVRCRDCDLVYLSPRPTPESIGTFYPPSYLPHRGPTAWGRWAPVVRRSEVRMDRARAEWVARRLPIQSGTPVLDVGCGRPSFLREMARRGAACVGVDSSSEGWRTDPSEWSGLHLMEGSFPEALPRLREIHPTGYQVITLWHLLEHVPDPRGLLVSLRALAAADALLLVEVPNLDSLTARAHRESWAGLHTPRHTAAYTPRTLTHLLRVSGWRVERVLPWGTLDAYVLWWLGRQIRRGRTLEGSLAPSFPGFVAGKAAALPLTLMQRWIPLGVQVALARPD